MSINKPQAEFLQVAALLRAAIADGEFPPGSQLPSEPELANRFGVKRATINRALSVLRSEGLVRPERGRGTTVNEIPVIRRDTAGRQRRETREAGQARGAFEAELREKGLTPKTVVSVSEVPAPDEVASLLEVNAGDTVLARGRVMYANDTPVQLATSYLPLDIAAGTALAEEDTGPGGAYSRLAELGHAPAEFNEVVRFRAPSESEIRDLAMDPDQRVASIVRTARTAEDRIVEVNVISLPAHQWELSFNWSAE
ncbi:GntR family transcriptional regulator [Actinomadura sp. 3N407]|uniref:GntR family transcriptional regulator n=1 Tax=Actinomadura sp. 3N407 TaxID=3457423 RepID=UPI003FCC7EED